MELFDETKRLVDGRDRLQGAFLTGEIKEKLAALPNMLRQARADEQAARKGVDEAKRQLSLVDSELTIQISAELDERGKPRYSNAEARTAALHSFRAHHHLYGELSEQLHGAQDRLEQNTADRQHLEEELAATRAIARVVAAELEYLASE